MRRRKKVHQVEGISFLLESNLKAIGEYPDLKGSHSHVLPRKIDSRSIIRSFSYVFASILTGGKCLSLVVHIVSTSGAS